MRSSRARSRTRSSASGSGALRLPQPPGPASSGRGFVPRPAECQPQQHLGPRFDLCGRIKSAIGYASRVPGRSPEETCPAVGNYRLASARGTAQPGNERREHRILIERGCRFDGPLDDLTCAPPFGFTHRPPGTASRSEVGGRVGRIAPFDRSCSGEAIAIAPHQNFPIGAERNTARRGDHHTRLTSHERDGVIRCTNMPH